MKMEIETIREAYEAALAIEKFLAELVRRQPYSHTRATCECVYCRSARAIEQVRKDLAEEVR